MRLIIATPTLYDEFSPFNHLFIDMLKGFLDSGIDITRVVACRNELESDYTYGLDRINHIKIKRKDSKRNSIIKRYIIDSITNIKAGRIISKSDADVLLEDVTYCSFWTIRAAKKKKKRVVAMVHDVWPDNAVQSGLINNNGLLYRYFELWQKYVYDNSDIIICISDDMKEFIVGKGVEAKKIEVIYNWGYSDEIVDIPWESNQFVKKYNLKKEVFYAVYAGNIGKMQNVELVVRAAKKLRNEAKIHFLIIGDGAKKEEIVGLSDSANNITILPFQPSDLAPHIYSMAGVNIIPLVEDGSKTAMPSKTGVVLSCGRPVVFCFGTDSMFSKKLQTYGAGLSVSAIDENELAEAIKDLSDMPFERNVGSDKLFKDYFVRTSNLNHYIRVLKDNNQESKNK